MRNTFSPEGYKHFQGELTKLKKRASDVGKEAGEEAGMNCDWHDNFGYEDAKRRLEMESQRVRELSDTLAGARVFDIVDQTNRVAIGNTVVYCEDGDLDEEREITIGAWGESAPDDGLISYEAPLAKALLTLEEGDTRILKKGNKSVEVEVLEIHPASHKYRVLVRKVFDNV